MSYEKTLTEDNDPYEFYYTQDLNDFDGEELEPKTEITAFGLIGPVLALLGTLVILGLFAAVHHRDKNGFTLWYLILAVIGVVIAGAVLGIIFMARGAI